MSGRLADDACSLCRPGADCRDHAWGWFRAARVESPVPAKGAYVAATLGVGIPNLAALTDRFAVSPDGTMLAIVDASRGGLELRRSLDSSRLRSLERRRMHMLPSSPRTASGSHSAPNARLMKIPTKGGTPHRSRRGTTISPTSHGARTINPLPLPPQRGHSIGLGQRRTRGDDRVPASHVGEPRRRAPERPDARVAHDRRRKPGGGA